jgi:hypothetical protein
VLGGDAIGFREVDVLKSYWCFESLEEAMES